jgi:hypothetical protein
MPVPITYSHKNYARGTKEHVSSACPYAMCWCPIRHPRDISFKWVRLSVLETYERRNEK